MRLIKFLSITLFCYLSVSCSFIKTGYNSAPKLTTWWLDDYFDLTQSQHLILKPALVSLHNWHRQHQLPQYITFLNTLQTTFASNNITAEVVCDQINTIKSNVHTLQVESIPIIIEIAPLLSAKQLTRFEEKLNKRAQKWKSEWWQDLKEDQLAVRLDKAEDFAEKVYGDLSEEQLLLIKNSVTEVNINPAISYKEITRRNNDAFTILSELKNLNNNINKGKESEQISLSTTDVKTKIVQAGFDRIQESPNIAYQKYVSDLSQHSCVSIANLHALTSVEQKLHAKNWLNNYIVQLTALQKND